MVIVCAFWFYVTVIAYDVVSLFECVVVIWWLVC